MDYIMHEAPWTVREEDFPWSADESDQVKFMLNYAVLAPSIYNAQPWMFKVTGSQVALYLDRARSIPLADPQNRNLVISCGAALFNLRMAVRHFGYEAVVRTFPDLDIPDLLAYIRLGQRREATAEENRLFEAILDRRTVRSKFSEDGISDSTLEAIRTAARTEGAQLFDVQDESRQQMLLDLIREANEIRSVDGPFHQELDRWTNPKWRKQPISRPSVPASSLRSAAASSKGMPRGLDKRQLVLDDEKLDSGDSMFVVLATPGDKMSSWLLAGQALGRVLLEAAASGLSAAYLNQPLGIDHLRERIGALIGDDVHPQMLLRLGHGAPGIPTHRVPVTRVTDEDGATL